MAKRKGETQQEYIERLMKEQQQALDKIKGVTKEIEVAEKEKKHEEEIERRRRKQRIEAGGLKASITMLLRHPEFYKNLDRYFKDIYGRGYGGFSVSISQDGTFEVEPYRKESVKPLTEKSPARTKHEIEHEAIERGKAEEKIAAGVRSQIKELYERGFSVVKIRDELRKEKKPLDIFQVKEVIREAAVEIVKEVEEAERAIPRGEIVKRTAEEIERKKREIAQRRQQAIYIRSWADKFAHWRKEGYSPEDIARKAREQERRGGPEFPKVWEPGEAGLPRPRVASPKDIVKHYLQIYDREIRVPELRRRGMDANEIVATMISEGADWASSDRAIAQVRIIIDRYNKTRPPKERVKPLTKGEMTWGGIMGLIFGLR